LFVVFLARLPHVLDEGFVEQRFGLVLERMEGEGDCYRRVGFVDGVVLKKSRLDALRGRGLFSVVGYPRPSEEGGMDGLNRENDLLRDPLELERVEVRIC